MQTQCCSQGALSHTHNSAFSWLYSVQAIKVLNMIKVYGKPIRVNKASQDKKTLDVGANLFIGNIDPDVDEKVIICREHPVPLRFAELREMPCEEAPVVLGLVALAAII